MGKLWLKRRTIRDDPCQPWMKTPEPEKNGQRDWPTLVLGLAILYLVLFFPVALILEAKPEVLAGAIGVLVTTFGGIVGLKAARK